MDVAVKGIIIKENKFLLLKQTINDKVWYSLPGGRVQGSNFESELKREIKEETNLDVEIINYVGDWFFIRQSNNMKTICKTFTCKPCSEELNSFKSEEYEIITDFVWLTKDEFIQGNYEDNKSLLNLFKNVEL